MGFLQDLIRSLTTPQPKVRTSGKNPEGFDFRKERELLAAYKPYKGHRDSNEYFAAMPMIDFYYKFLNLDDKYLQACIHYCEVSISCLDAKDMRSFVHTVSIPAFKRLVIIYEKQGDYVKARETAELALKYVARDDAAYYAKKIKSSLNKQFQK